MKNERVRRAIRLLIGLAILTVIVFVINLIRTRDTSINDIIGDLVAKPKFNDTYNGVYTYIEPLEDKYKVTDRCSINSINNYIYIINDDYYVFRNSCLGTYEQSRGKTKDLNIASTDTEYYVVYKENRYNKDYSVNAIVPGYGERVVEGTSVDLNAMPVIIKETEIDGYYYEWMDRNISGLSAKNGLKVNLKNLGNGNFKFLITAGALDRRDPEAESKAIYTLNINKNTLYPTFYTYGENLGIIEKNNNSSDSNKYGYRLMFISKKGVIYDTNKMFPIVVNDVKLDTENYSIYIAYNFSDRKYKMFVGNDKKFCKQNGDPKSVAYYEFEISYSYQAGGFSKPVYVKTGYEGESCSYIEQYVKG